LTLKITTAALAGDSKEHKIIWILKKGKSLSPPYYSISHDCFTNIYRQSFDSLNGA
jgi:hypothetical protein